jgi:hypothetical protein
MDWGSGLLFARNRIARNEIEIRLLRLVFACLFQYAHSWTCSNSLVATPGALAALEKSGQNAMEFFSRYGTGD